MERLCPLLRFCHSSIIAIVENSWYRTLVTVAHVMVAVRDVSVLVALLLQVEGLKAAFPTESGGMDS